MLHLDKQFFQILHEQIEAGRDRDLIAQLGELRAADIAEVLENLRIDDANYLYRLLENDIKADVLMELDEEKRTELLSGMTAGEIAEEVLENLDSDDAADVMSELPKSKAEEVIQMLEDNDQASDIRDLLNYEEGTAGAMMAKELVKVQAEWTVNRAIREIRRQAEELEQVYTVYVIDPLGKLTGRLSLKHLLLNAESTRTKIQEIQETEDIITIGDLESSEKATKLMERYDLVALPVVNHEHELVGRITIDDVIDVIREDADRSLMSMAGLEEDIDTFAPFSRAAPRRAVWLGVNLLTAFIAASFINIFQGTIEKVVALAVLMPIVASMGGVAGTQTLTVLVRGIALGQVSRNNQNWLINRELLLGLMNGALWASVVAVTASLWFDDWNIGLIIAAAMVINLLTAALAGATLPLLMTRINIDPALAGSVVLTTITDVVGFVSFLGLATLYYG